MKALLIGIACAVVLIVVAVVGLGWWGATQKLDTSNPETANGFKKGFEKSCVDGVNKTLTAAGKTLSAEDLAKYTQLCDCVADDTLARASENGGIKISDIALHPEKFQQQMQESSKACADKLGMPGN